MHSRITDSITDQVRTHREEHGRGEREKLAGLGARAHIILLGRAIWMTFCPQPSWPALRLLQVCVLFLFLLANFTHTHTHTHIHTHTHTHTHTHIHTHTHTRARFLSERMNVSMLTEYDNEALMTSSAKKYTHTHTHTHPHTHPHTDTHTHTLIHSHTHTHTHTRIHSFIHTLAHTLAHTQTQ